MEIGEGAFGKVWKVTDLLTKRTYALKVMQKKKYITKLTQNYCKKKCSFCTKLKEYPRKN